MSTRLTHCSATELARLIRDRAVSAVEVMDEHLAAIERLNPQLNAIVAVAEDARERAATHDRVLATGDPIGPLHGVPFTAKDIIETAGLATTVGMVELADNRPEHDATIVARMRTSGAILLGKTNCPRGGSGGVTDNELHGRTLNPYDARRSPGGSSGGEAAAIAAGMSACGLGSDSGGSLRMPAHFCGIATLKPTAGRIPLTGVLDEDGQIGSMSDPRTQPGPMARRVEDLGTLLAIIAGPDGIDGGSVPVALGDPAGVEMRGLRVMLHRSDGVASPDPRHRARPARRGRGASRGGGRRRGGCSPAGRARADRAVLGFLWRRGDRVRAARHPRRLGYLPHGDARAPRSISTSSFPLLRRGRHRFTAATWSGAIPRPTA